jgi:hypothetical protein
MKNKKPTGKIKLIEGNKKNGLTIKELNQLLNKWKKKFELKNWDISIKIVKFLRTDYCQSGDFEIDVKNKKACVLLTENPFKDEETVLVHELIHILLWDLDSSIEDIVLKNCKKFEGDHLVHMEKLEETVNFLTKVILKK